MRSNRERQKNRLFVLTHDARCLQNNGGIYLCWLKMQFTLQKSKQEQTVIKRKRNIEQKYFRRGAVLVLNYNFKEY